MQLEQRDNSTFVLFQPSCLKHCYIRNQHDLNEIVERPQRIKAVTAGIASVWSKHEQALKLKLTTAEEDDELGNLMKGLSIEKKKRIELKGKTSPFDILFSNDQLSIDSPALKMIHSLPNYPPDYSLPPPPRSPSKKESFPTHSPWPQQLLHLIKQVPPPTPTTTRRESEIPPHLPQGDLYLSPESDQAIFGALGAVCKGVDLIMNNGYDNGFIVIRPPGHHCGESNPQGFCFLNNISIASAHSHLKHGINRVVILDIDLHHGNGTQEIVWKLNEKANQILNSHHEQLQQRRRRSSSPNKSKLKDKDKDKDNPPRPLQIMYSSLHDVLSYPCESGDPYMISSASVQISGPHQQFIQNTHLEPYSSTSEFFKSKQKEKGEGSEGSEGSSLWEKYWNNLGGKKLLDFLTKTSASSEETLILISCGFDASVHEFSSMSRHSLNVPDKFFKKFAFEISKVAKKVSNGKVLFVLEGGYSDKALSSGSFSVLEGLLLAGSSSSSDNNSEEEEKEKKVKVKVEEEDEEEDLKDLERILQVCGLDNNNTLGGKKKIGKGGGGSLRENDKEWIKRTKEIFDYLQLQQLRGDNDGEDDDQDQIPTSTATDRGGRRQLRERKIRLDYAGLADHSLPLATQQKQHQQQSPLITIPSPPAQSVPPSSTTNASTTTTTAFSSIPPTSFYSPLPTTATTTTPTTQDERNEQGEATEQDREKKNNVNNPPPPAIKFIWKQGGIGGNSNSMGQPRM
ncbi:hypothetical protein JCM3765_004668 [Sporobolomyces pararoseus]